METTTWLLMFEMIFFENTLSPILRKHVFRKQNTLENEFAHFEHEIRSMAVEFDLFLIHLDDGHICWFSPGINRNFCSMSNDRHRLQLRH